MMNKNVKIAKELVKLAKSLMANNEDSFRSDKANESVNKLRQLGFETIDTVDETKTRMIYYKRGYIENTGSEKEYVLEAYVSNDTGDITCLYQNPMDRNNPITNAEDFSFYVAEIITPLKQLNETWKKVEQIR